MLIRSETEDMMRPGESPPAKSGVRREMFGSGEEEQQWQRAADRMLLYLRCLNCRTSLALEFTLQALKEADKNLAKDSESTLLFESMQALYRQLDQKRPQSSDRNCSLLDAWCQCSPHPLPPHRRLPMITKGVISFRRHSLLKKIFLSGK
jgi:hypothetical protein